MMIGNRQCHGDLTIVLLAQHAAILPPDPDRMPPLLGEARVIDDSSLDRSLTLHLRQYQFADLGQNPLVRPVAFTNLGQSGVICSGRAFLRYYAER
jgi:hypothetical protein